MDTLLCTIILTQNLKVHTTLMKKAKELSKNKSLTLNQSIRQAEVMIYF